MNQPSRFTRLSLVGLVCWLGLMISLVFHFYVGNNSPALAIVALLCAIATLSCLVGTWRHGVQGRR